MASKVVLIGGGTGGIGQGYRDRPCPPRRPGRHHLQLGVVRTDFGAQDQAWLFTIVSHVVLPFLKTPAEGAETSINLASSPDVECVTGQFFANRKAKTANQLAYDTEISTRLWKVSADLVGTTMANP